MSILHQLGIKGAEERYPSYRKIGICFGHDCLQVKAILSSSHNNGPDGQAFKEDNEPSGSSQMTSIMGDRIKWAWRIVPPKNNHQSPSLGWLCHRVHNKRRWKLGATPWMVRMNGSSNRHARGIGVVLQTSEVDVIECVVLQFSTTKNEAKYEALLMSINLAKAH